LVHDIYHRGTFIGSLELILTKHKFLFVMAFEPTKTSEVSYMGSVADMLRKNFLPHRLHAYKNE
jgi:hypothetical protein